MWQSWRLYFENVENGLGPGQAYVPPPFVQHTGGVTAAPRAGDTGTHSDKAVLDAIKADNLIRAYQVLPPNSPVFVYDYALQANGHSLSTLDPLSIPGDKAAPKELQPSFYGFCLLPSAFAACMNCCTAESDMSRSFAVLDAKLFPAGKATLAAIVDRLKSLYAGDIGYEFTYLQHKEQQEWWQDRISTQKPFTKDEKQVILKGLVEGAGFVPCFVFMASLNRPHSFEQFLYVKYGGEKRLGVEGCEVLIPGMQRMVIRAAHLHKVNNMVFGMPHRGRLNVLHNVLKKKLEVIFKEFESPLVDSKQEVSFPPNCHSPPHQRTGFWRRQVPPRHRQHGEGR